MCSKFLIHWIIFLASIGIAFGQQYTDCERPPPIEKGKASLYIDDEGTFATATYSCDNGFELHGESELICNADTDIWKGELPKCKPVGSSVESATVKEEELEVTSPQTESTVEQIENEIGEDTTEIALEPLQPQTQQKKKKKFQDVPEDNSIDVEFVLQLDLSCVSDSPVAAPTIADAFVLKYARRRHGDNIFLVAVYDCDEDYELLIPAQNRLYCSQRTWIGKSPKCIQKLDDDYSDGNLDYDNTDRESTNTENVPVEHLQFNNEIDHIDADKKNENTHEEITGTDGDNLEEKLECGTDHGCDHSCVVSDNTIKCICNEGFYLDESNGKTCHDIDECRNPDVADECEFGCENLPGSYRCRDADVISVTQPTNVPAEPVDLTPIKACGDGFTLDAENKCIDIDECALGNTGCEHCQNAYGGYQCICPDGFELSEDEKTCRDIDECVAFIDYDYDGTSPKSLCSHECVNTIGSWICRCPVNFHLQNDKRSCAQDYCQHLGDTNNNKTKCSHECVDNASGYECKCPSGLKLGSDGKTCTEDGATRACDDELDQCSPGECIDLEHGQYKCHCPTGYENESGRCADINECIQETSDCSHNCHNTDGSYTCSCPDGYKIGSDSHICQDVNECELNPSICGHQICQNVDGSFSCTATDVINCDINNGGCSDICFIENEERFCKCSDGYDLLDDLKTCVPKNFCDQNNGDCQQICNAEENVCECLTGYTLNVNGKFCDDVNECQVNNGGCDQNCVNSEGGYECTCRPGYEIDDTTEICIDVDECKDNNGNCEHYCTNLLGSYVCSCPDGYQVNDVNPEKCNDVNECLTNNGNCSHNCVNLLGSYQCSCPEGQFLVNNENTCDFINECEINNGGCSHTCHYESGSIRCACPKGYQLDSDIGKICTDINECELRNGGCAHTCTNTNGSHECSCTIGFQLGSDGGSCIDLDECINDNGNCSNICINLLGSYICACEAGFELDIDKHTCIDIDECKNSMHDCTHECINTEGTYECACPEGFTLSRDHFTCNDINECEFNNTCEIQSDCVNTLGSYHCSCPTGHKMSQLTKACDDINECDDPIKVCSHECRNTVGAYECLCPVGLELAPNLVTCIDINECKINGNNGGCSHHCINTEGSFVCTCPTGFSLDDDKFTCKDIDECAIENGKCEQRCINSDGSFSCACNNGFILAEDGKHCINSDPCALRNGGCAHVCDVRDNQALCFCYKGFELSQLDNTSCIDIDECAREHDCDGECINTYGSYKCACPTGYRFNDKNQCVDVDECAENNGGCSEIGQCINLLGGFRCICPSGYRLAQDKHSCEEVKDNCKAHTAPKNGFVSCTRSRHRTQNIFRVKCSFSCRPGYNLVGPAEKYCSEQQGWDNYQPECKLAACPQLQQPRDGTYAPANCLTESQLPGGRCVLHCSAGFKPENGRTIVCGRNLEWSPIARLNCVEDRTDADEENEIISRFGDEQLIRPTAVENQNSFKKNITKIPVISHGSLGQHGYKLYETAQRVNPSFHLKPFIKCPRDTTIILPKDQKSVYIKLEQPRTNVDWRTQVDVHPQWAKRLEAHLTAGVHVITFQARSPSSDATDTCRTTLTVKDAQPPTVTYCTQPLEVQLLGNEVQRAVNWQEPVFRSPRPLKQIFKTKNPGGYFAPGIHRITYIATDIDGLSSKCEFTITVKSPLNRVVSSPQRLYNRLENHESYLLCPNRPAIKLDANFPNIPSGCFIKNVRVNHYNHHRRRHSLVPNNNGFKHYSSWNTPAAFSSHVDLRRRQF